MKIIKCRYILLTAGMAATGLAANTVYAASEIESNDSTTQEVQEVVVVGQAGDGLTSKTVIDRETIRNTPDGNGNMTDLLKSHVNVRFEKDAENGFQNGEIKPAGVSINGAPNQQTAYMVDGVDINNDVDPTGILYGDGTAGVMPGLSSEQAYFYDSSMIGSVTVYDSNVPASLGGFTGGAIVADSLFYSGVDRVGMNYRTTNHHMAKMTVDENIREQYENARVADDSFKAEFQPKYQKDFINVVVEQGLTDELGMVLGVSRRESAIAQNRVVNKDGLVDKENQKRLIDNVMANYRWQPTAEKKLDLSLRYSAYDSEQFYGNIVQNNFVDQHRAYGTTVSWEQAALNGSVKALASYDHFNDSRDSNSAHVVTTYFNWEPFYDGGYGDSELAQENVGLKVDYKSNPLRFIGMDHRISSGVSVKKTDYHFERFTDVHSTIFYTDMPSLNEGVKHLALKGKVKTDYTNYALYLDDSMTVGNVSLRPGVRVEQDDYLKNLNVAPRFSASWQAFDNTRFVTGANRYFGRSFGAMKLAEGVAKLSQDDSRDFKSLKGMKTPYSNELTIGADQNISNFTISARYIWREYKDRIIHRKLQSSQVDEYVNGNDYAANVYTLQISNIQPWVVGPTLWNTTLGFDWLDTDRDDLGASQNPNELVHLDGKQMTLREMEAKVNSSQEEWIIRLGIDMKLPEYAITWSNKVYVKAPVQGYDYIDDNAFDESMYKSYDYDLHTQWDTQLRWQPSTWGNQDIYFQADLLNVLNETRRTGTQVNSGNDFGLYSPGRQLWLEVGYNF